MRALLDPRLDQTGTNCAFITKVLDECKQWEKMPNRSEPVTPQMIKYIIDLSKKAKDKDSKICAFANWLPLGKMTGFQLSEWAQEKRQLKQTKKFKRNKDGSVQAFRLDDFIFSGPYNQRLQQGQNTNLSRKKKQRA